MVSGMSYRLDLERLIADLGGPTQVAYVLTKMGLPTGARTPEKWVERDSMNAVYLANLLAHELLTNGPFDLTRYLVPATDDQLRRPRGRSRPTAPARRQRPSRGQSC